MRTGRLTFVAMTMGAVMAGWACGGEGSISDPGPAAVASVHVSPNEHQAVVGDEVALVATLKDAAGRELTGRTVAWTSENEAVATVSAAGRVLTRSVGSAYITASSGGRSNRALVTVAARPPIPVATVDVTPTTLTIEEGQEQQLTAVAKDAAGGVLENRSIEWQSPSPEIAEVSATGLMTANRPGTASIRAWVEGKTGSTIVTVRPAPAAAVTLNTHQLVLQLLDVSTLTATVTAANGKVLTGRPITWTTSNAAVATVANDGRVTARAGGQAWIVATSGGKSDSAAVTVAAATPAFDLLYDRWDALGTTMVSDIHRLDIGTAGAAAARVFGVVGTWDAVASPDGSRIAFVAADGGHSAVFVLSASGSGSLVKVAGGPLSADQPAWSPDGTQIAYRLWSNYSPARIWVANADGSNAHAVTGALDGEHQHPTWSPRQADGSYRIAFSRARPDGEGYVLAQIWSVRADGEQAAVVSSSGGTAYDDQPSWSPDGSTVAFVRTGADYDHRLFLVDVASRNTRPLFTSDPDGAQSAPEWSPDGSLIAFVSSHDIDFNGYRKQIYTARPDGTGLTRRTFDFTDKDNPSWIRRGAAGR